MTFVVQDMEIDLHRMKLESDLELTFTWLLCALILSIFLSIAELNPLSALTEEVLLPVLQLNLTVGLDNKYNI